MAFGLCRRADPRGLVRQRRSHGRSSLPSHGGRCQQHIETRPRHEANPFPRPGVWGGGGTRSTPRCLITTRGVPHARRSTQGAQWCAARPVRGSSPPAWPRSPPPASSPAARAVPPARPPTTSRGRLPRRAAPRRARRPQPTAEPAEVTVTPADASTKVLPSTPVVVEATTGTIEKVTVTDAKGAALEGELDAEGTWTATSRAQARHDVHRRGRRRRHRRRPADDHLDLQHPQAQGHGDLRHRLRRLRPWVSACP